jgi:hypothetical protein
MKSDKNNAKLIFDAQIAEMWLEYELYEIFQDAEESYPLARIGFDYYDESIELYFDKLFRLSPEQIEKFYKLLADNGFTHGWLNFPNKEDELHFNCVSKSIIKTIKNAEGKFEYLNYEDLDNGTPVA